MRKMMAGCLVGTLLAMISVWAQAQAFPDKPIHLVVPFTAGGPTDLLGRTIATKLAVVVGQPVVVDNYAGAGGGIAAGYTAKAAPDGYTIMLITTGTQTINPALYPKLSYDPVRDFTYVTTIVQYSLALVVNPNIEVKTIAELIALARARPNALNYSSAGHGASAQLAAELFKTAAGLQVQHIPYKGSAAALTAVMTGDAAFTFDIISTALPQIRAGKVRALGWSGVNRSTLIPDVPTIAEAALPGFDVTGWMGIGAPAGLPKNVLDRLHDSIARAINDPDLKDRLLAQGYEISLMTPDAFAALVQSDLMKWGRVVRGSGAKVE